MNDSSQIIERLDRIEAQLAPMAASAQAIRELRDEMGPRINELVHALILELADVESDFQLEDLLFLIKKVLRNVKNLNFALDQLKNIIDFSLTAEPLLKSTVPQMIFYLDDLERKGVLRLLGAAIEALRNLGAQFSQEELDQMAQGLVRLAAVMKKLAAPEALEVLERAAEIPGRLDLDRIAPFSARDLLNVLKDPQSRQGLGVVLALTRALAVLRG